MIEDKHRRTCHVIAQPIGSVNRVLVHEVLRALPVPAYWAYADDSEVYEDPGNHESVNLRRDRVRPGHVADQRH